MSFEPDFAMTVDLIPDHDEGAAIADKTRTEVEEAAKLRAQRLVRARQSFWAIFNEFAPDNPKGHIPKKNGHPLYKWTGRPYMKERDVENEVYRMGFRHCIPGTSEPDWRNYSEFIVRMDAEGAIETEFIGSAIDSELKKRVDQLIAEKTVKVA